MNHNTGKKLALLILILCPTLYFGGFTLKAQEKEDVIYTIVQEQPRFQGDMFKYIRDNIKYPEAELKAKISGTVYVTFVVEKDGHLTGIKVLRGVRGGPGLDAEAVRVISTMPAWTPGKQNGHAERVQYNLPIRFTGID